MEPIDEVAARRIGQTVVGKWTLERLLGAGGMAAVYEARDAEGNFAALKILHPEMTLRKDVRERFLREAYVANKVGHPGAVQVIEHFDGGEEPSFLVMELLHGDSLSDRVRQHGPLPVAELLDYLDQILDVLAAAHAQGIIHRDLKPDNLFITTEGRVKVLDFGVARVLHDAPGSVRTQTGMALGTLPYMAPEQALGRSSEIDGRADLFAIGATTFRILAGRKVHEEKSEAELLIAMASKPAPALATVAPKVPADVCAIIDIALAFSRDARYPDAKTMQADVRAVRQGQPPPFAKSRSSTREQATRIDMPAVVLPAGARAAAAVAASRAPAGAPTVRMPAEPQREPSSPAAAPLASSPTAAAVAPSSPTAAAPPAPVDATAKPEAPKARKSPSPLFLALGALAVVALGGAAAWAVFGQSSSNAASEQSAEPTPETESTSSSERGEAQPRRTTATTTQAATTQSSPAAPPAEGKRKGHPKRKAPSR